MSKNILDSLFMQFSGELQEKQLLQATMKKMGERFFSQQYLHLLVNEKPALYPKSKHIIENYGGLCDIICNYITHNDMLEDGQNLHLTSSIIPIISLEKEYSGTHMLESGLVSDLATADTYPFSIVSSKHSPQVLKKTTDGVLTINKYIIEDAVIKLQDGEYIKFCIYQHNSQGGFKTGHSMLFKKLPEGKFIFFDPEQGLSNILNIDQLVDQLNVLLQYYSSIKTKRGLVQDLMEVAFINNTQFIQNLQEQKILSLTPSFHHSAKAKIAERDLDNSRLDTNMLRKSDEVSPAFVKLLLENLGDVKSVSKLGLEISKLGELYQTSPEFASLLLTEQNNISLLSKLGLGIDNLTKLNETSPEFTQFLIQSSLSIWLLENALVEDVEQLRHLHSTNHKFIEFMQEQQELRNNHIQEVIRDLGFKNVVTIETINHDVMEVLVFRGGAVKAVLSIVDVDTLTDPNNVNYVNFVATNNYENVNKLVMTHPHMGQELKEIYNRSSELASFIVKNSARMTEIFNKPGGEFIAANLGRYNIEQIQALLDNNIIPQDLLKDLLNNKILVTSGVDDGTLESLKDTKKNCKETSGEPIAAPKPSKKRVAQVGQLEGMQAPSSTPKLYKPGQGASR